MAEAAAEMNNIALQRISEIRRTKKDIYMRDSILLRKRRRRYPSHRRGSIHAIKSGTEDNDRMDRESSQAIFGTKKKTIKMNVIHCYPPTNDSDDETKDPFCSTPQSILDKCRENNMIILMGDFNAKIDMDNNGYEEVTGTHGVEEMNENEERFADTCALTNIVIGGCIFTHTKRYAKSHGS